MSRKEKIRLSEQMKEKDHRRKKVNEDGTTVHLKEGSKERHRARKACLGGKGWRQKNQTGVYSGTDFANSLVSGKQKGEMGQSL